ncbi:hydroxyproline dehydrogenase-like [Haliotis rubra]|uniref:hydroxyproline dehydrogenase-like n=1 Tax=Haliotis rubra TaxID=36100 RepID=UPI001EE52E51|nr:hydroxyproline dehydrogenase-like [Haliotis rubra]
MAGSLRKSGTFLKFPHQTGVFSLRCVTSPSRWASTKVGMASHIHRQSANPGLGRITAPAAATQHDKVSMFFGDPCVLFKHKTTWELFRALVVFKLCSWDRLVDHSVTLMRLGQRLLGTRLFSAVMKPVFYGQFVAGTSKAEVLDCVSRQRKAGIGPLLSVPIEQDVSSSNTNEECYDDNLQVILNCINMTAEVKDKIPMMHIRMTSVLPANLCLSLSKVFPEPSTNPERVKEVADAMETGKTMVVPGLSETELSQFWKSLARLKTIGQLAVKKDVIVMVDAEYTYVNHALNLATLAMMLNYNVDNALVFYTYQNYLKSTPLRLRRDLDLVDKYGVCFGAKVVRGAYMEKERMLAKTQGYPDPINDTFDDTSSMYHDSMELLLSRISKDPKLTRIIIATHNIDTIKLAKERLKHYNIDLETRSVFFGQVYGMGDHISCRLGYDGYPVYKSIPYGSVTDTLPYLLRRAQENRAVLQGVRQEKDLFKTALKGRFWGNSGV